MKKILLMLIAILAIGLVFASANTKSVYLVKSHSPNLKAKFGLRHNFPEGFTTFMTEAQVKGLIKKGVEVESVPLYHYTAPPGACSPWPACNKDDGNGDSRPGEPSDQTPWGIEMVYNDSSLTSTTGGSGMNVAVLDGGIDKDHPDLKRRVKQCKDFTKGRKIQNKCTDRDGHGTHVSGTIAADTGEDGLGIWGVAPEANIFAYKVCTESGCWTDDIAAAIDYAGSKGAHIVSMSLGGDTESTLIKNAVVRNPHLLFVAAGGNDGPALGSIDYPGANVNVMAIAALDSSYTPADFSSRGVNNGDFLIEKEEIEMAAPGVDVESTCTGSLDGSVYDKDGQVNGYCIISGTSMATPHVSGLAAKMWKGDAQSTRTYLQNRAKLFDLYTSGDDPATGFGLPTVG